MNLHGLAVGIISAVNPMTPATFQANVGPTIQPDGTRVPNYLAPVPVSAQVQELTQADLALMEGLIQQGTTVAIYLFGTARGAVRVTQQGGDLVTIPSGTRQGVYLVSKVLELWPDWVKVAGVLQNQPASGQPLPGLALGDNPP